MRLKTTTTRRVPAPDSGRRVAPQRQAVRPVVRFAPSPEMLRAFRVITGQAAATRAEQWAARRTLAVGLAKLGLRNSAYGRSLDLALLAVQAAEGQGLTLPWGQSAFYRDMQDAVAGLRGIYRMTTADTAWLRSDGPFPPPADGAANYQGTTMHNTWYASPQRWYYVTPSSYPNGLFQNIGGVYYHNLHHVRTNLYSGLRGLSNRLRFRYQLAGAPSAVPQIVNDQAVKQKPVSISDALGFEGVRIPHARVAQVSRWREIFAPRPDGKPIRESPPAPVPVPRPNPNWSMQIGPSGKPRPAEAHKYRPPPKGTKERKALTKLDTALRIGSAVTEGIDVIDAIYAALPRYYQNPKLTPQQKLFDIYRHINEVDIPRAVLNILLAQASDAVIARASKPLRKALDTQLGSKAPSQRPWFYGPV